MRGFLIRAIALYAVLFSAWAFAQSPVIQGFPPGVFTSRAAIDGGVTTCSPQCIGDAYPGWAYYHSIDECYNFVYSGSVIDLQNSGATLGTRMICANGVTTELVSASACTFVTGNACSTRAVACAVACSVRTVYDQSGGAGGPFNITNTTFGNQPTYTQSCQNGHACATCTRASSQGWASASGPTTTLDATGVLSNVLFFLGNPTSTPGTGSLTTQTNANWTYGAGTISKTAVNAGGTNTQSATMTTGTTYGILAQMFSQTSGFTSQTALNGSTTGDTGTTMIGTASASGIIIVCGTSTYFNGTYMSSGFIKIAAASFTFSAMNTVTHGYWNN